MVQYIIAAGVVVGVTVGGGTWKLVSKSRTNKLHEAEAKKNAEWLANYGKEPAPAPVASEKKEEAKKEETTQTVAA